MAKNGQINEIEKVWIEEFIKDLEQTAQQVRKLLDEINSSKVELASIKTQLSFILDNVKDLSHLVRDGNDGPSLLTKIAILEKAIEEIKKYIAKDMEEDKDIITRVALLENKISEMQPKIDKIILEEYDETKKIEEKSNKWKLYAIVIGGIFAITSSIISLAISLIGG